MTQGAKYSVVVDGEVVEAVPTKKAAREALKDVPDTASTEIREFDPETDVVKPQGNDIEHLR